MATLIYEVMFQWNSCPWDGCGVDLARTSYGFFTTLEAALDYIHEDQRDREKDKDIGDKEDPHAEYQIWSLSVADGIDNHKKKVREREKCVCRIKVMNDDDDWEDEEDIDDESE